MPGVLKVVVVILFLLILIRKKWDLGLVLFLGTGLTALLFLMPLKTFVRGVWDAAVSGETLSLVGIFWLVIYLGRFLQEKGHFRIMVDALKHLVPEPRLILALPPAFIGLLPMFAGAMMSAPIIEEAGNRPGAGISARPGRRSSTTGSATSGSTPGRSTPTSSSPRPSPRSRSGASASTSCPSPSWPSLWG